MLTRRVRAGWAALLVLCLAPAVLAGEPVVGHLGPRRELFLDGLLIHILPNDRLKLHQPVVVPTDAETSLHNVNGDPYVLRLDGFTSLHAGAEQGKFASKPRTFSGDRLEMDLYAIRCFETDGGEDKRIPPFKRIVIDEDPPKQPYYKMVGDLTGDGKAEIVVAGRAGPIVMYSRPDWKKTIISDEPFRGGVNGEPADINADGELDLVMGGVVWFENPGGTGGRWTMHEIDNESIHDVEVADLTGDGLLDVVCRDQSAFGGRGDAIFIYYQQAPDTWRKEVLDCPHGEGLKVADVDGDGKPDIVIGAIWFRNDSSEWAEHIYTEEWTEPDTKVEVGDINGNGRPDIVVTPAELQGERYRISWFESPAEDKTGPWKEHVVVRDIECVIHSLALGDFDQDGSRDVAYAEMHQGEDPDEVVVMFNLEQGAKWEKQVIDSEGSHDIVAAEVAGSEALDLVGANHAGTHPVVVWENLLGSD